MSTFYLNFLCNSLNFYAGGTLYFLFTTCSLSALHARKR